MARHGRHEASGFSLVELLVAVLFIGILMAGMANVFKSSVTTLSTSSEGISSARRNRMSIDLLYDDLNHAGLYLSDLSSPPKLSTTNPAFYIIPNVAITGAGADDPAAADQLFFYLDEPLPFEGTLSGTGGAGAGKNLARNAAELVLAGVAPDPAIDSTFTIDCKDASYAAMIKQGYSVVFKDAWETFFVQGAPTLSGASLTIQLGASPTVGTTGTGPSGAPPKAKHILGSDVLFFRPAQVVRYSVKMKLFDPQKATGVPCLVRDQGTYDATGFVADAAQESIVAENVAGFKAYLSADSGQTWAGYGKTYTGLAAGWNNGLRAELDTQLASAGRQDYQTTQGREDWIRSIPTLVRLDITTRTAVKRAEYSATPLTSAAYKDFTQSLVIVPRHFGLSMN
ncbi:MAG: prepilin-type N-terminal cleavage/methylation domain-containing protein [Geothrix sp.]|jgi:hypothetical protein|uniref:Prepilin-type N-terminal cleavage/methylation domain-containing protein n=1 Tax=Candidatus Geothrix odensensis TaxID=2954440 RepID=A0A936F3M2_9BACT|nr:prepilin-type N-terminal cleavage/methylation domain-containing protein [Holophagaceae bacterium]MBK8573519.1 prepilin-type N-terminal cleavage/methylation domain-containing protein [Candidatus Geothrix odensensis]MBP7617202.1 prepilin-type N-terminal cleavage/methylation domain-containing protein [Geothrix sp.]